MRASSTPKPLRQGELDGLCGLYAVVNAARVLCPELDDEASRQLFRAIYRTAENFAQTVSFAHDGLGFDDLVRLLTEAQELLSSTRAIVIAVKTLPLAGPPSLAKLWGSMTDELRDQAVLILGLSGLEDHWSVAHRATPEALQLIDSSGLKTLPRAKCSLHHSEGRFCLEPSEILVVRRCAAGAAPW